MVNNISKEDIIKVIQKNVIDTFGSDYYHKTKILLLHNFDNRELLKFKAQPQALYTLDLGELYLILCAIEKVNSKKCKVLNYFTEYEVKRFKNYTRTKDNIDKYYVLQNAFQLDDNQWTAVASVEQIAMMRKYSIIRVDPNFQRQSKTLGRDESGEILKYIHVNHKRVNEIKNDIINDEYKYNTIRINMMDDGEFSPIFNKENGTITIPTGADCIIPDGNHRSQAAEIAYFANPELQKKLAHKYFQIAFTFYNPEEVKKTIFQEWNTEPVKKSHISSMKISFTNMVVDEIKRNNRSEPLYTKRISTVIDSNSFIEYNTLALAIEKYYETDKFVKKSQSIKIANWIIEFFNEITELITDDLVNYKRLKRVKWSLNKYAWGGFIYLSSLLKDDPDWKSKMIDIFKTIDWNISECPFNGYNFSKNINDLELFFNKKVGDINV